MVETCDATTRPLESLLRVTKITHYEPIFPSTFFGPGASEITGWWRTIMYGPQSEKKTNKLISKPKLSENLDRKPQKIIIIKKKEKTSKWRSWKLTSDRLRERRRLSLKNLPCLQLWLRCLPFQVACWPRKRHQRTRNLFKICQVN